MKNSTSNLGYLDYSPYRFNPYNIINSNSITMNGVSRNLLLVPDKGRPILARGNSGNYHFPNASNVIEIPIYQDGGLRKPIFTSNPNDPRLRASLEKLGNLENGEYEGEHITPELINYLKNNGYKVDVL